LHLREPAASAAETRRQVERWLRARQLDAAEDVLIDLGPDGGPAATSALRTLLGRTLRSMRRAGVVGSIREPAPGQFTIATAPLRALFEAAPRRGEAGRLATRPVEAVGMTPSTRSLLRALAGRTFQSLGVTDPGEPAIEGECRRLATLLSGEAADPPGDDALRRAVERAIREYDEFVL
jgi:hypothetical protein